jgi:hypothetical protein
MHPFAVRTSTRSSNRLLRECNNQSNEAAARRTAAV